MVAGRCSYLSSFWLNTTPGLKTNWIAVLIKHGVYAAEAQGESQMVMFKWINYTKSTLTESQDSWHLMSSSRTRSSFTLRLSTLNPDDI